MKKLLFFTAITLLTLWGLGGFSLYAQSSVNVTLLKVVPGTPATITFSVGWTTPPSLVPLHRDTVWVFADFQPIDVNGAAGAWKAATFVSSPIVTGGTGSIVSGSFNGRGFYLAGSSSGAFASTLTATLTEPVNTKFNACLYVSDYPPNATVNTGGGYTLHGTPPFVINGSIRETTGTFAAGTCITSFSDSTGCPGWVDNGATFVAGSIATRGDTVCLGGGGAPKMISSITPVSGGDGSAIYSWYKDGVPIPGATDANYTPPAADAATVGAHTYTRMVHDNTCNLTPVASTGSWVLKVSEVPTVTLEASASTVCAGSAITLTATTGAASYQFNGGSWQTANTTTVTVNANSTYAVKARSDWGCETEASATVTVQTAPTAPTSLTSATICSGTSVTLTASGGANGSGAYFQWGTGTTVGSSTAATTTAATYSVAPTSSTTYWVRRIGNTNCTNTTGGVTATITVQTAPTAPTALTANPTYVSSGNSSITLTVSGGDVGSGAIYQWGTGTTIGNNLLTPATTSAPTYIVASPASTTIYWVRRIGNTACTNMTDGVTQTVFNCGLEIWTTNTEITGCVSLSQGCPSGWRWPNMDEIACLQATSSVWWTFPPQIAGFPINQMNGTCCPYWWYASDSDGAIGTSCYGSVSHFINLCVK
jgi:hypothetical protein